MCAIDLTYVHQKHFDVESGAVNARLPQTSGLSIDQRLVRWLTGTFMSQLIPASCNFSA